MGLFSPEAQTFATWVAAVASVVTLYLFYTRGRDELKFKAIDRFKSTASPQLTTTDAEADVVALNQYLTSQYYLGSSTEPLSITEVFSHPEYFSEANCAGVRVVSGGKRNFKQEDLAKVPLHRPSDVEKALNRLIKTRIDVLRELVKLKVDYYHYEEHLESLYLAVHSLTALLLGEYKSQRDEQLLYLRKLKLSLNLD